MKIRSLRSLLVIDILTLLMVLFVVLFPPGALRTLIGIPFLIFFPGYALIEALYASKARLSLIERIGLSIGMSIAIDALLGLILNFTSWGITLETVLYSTSLFIFLMSVIAVVRTSARNRGSVVADDVDVKLPGWDGSGLNKALTVVLAIAILGVLTTLGYAVASPRIGQKYTEFYLLGHGGKAEDYPSGYLMADGTVVEVSYGESIIEPATYGKVLVGIVNREQENTTYSLVLSIEGQQTGMILNGQKINSVDGLTLTHGEKWEEDLGFAPVKVGQNQKVEFVLYKNGAAAPYLKLHFWINVRTQS